MILLVYAFAFQLVQWDDLCPPFLIHFCTCTRIKQSRKTYTMQSKENIKYFIFRRKCQEDELTSVQMQEAIDARSQELLWTHHRIS